MELIDVLKRLADLHGTTLAEEVARHNAELEQRIASGYMHPIVSDEERLVRTKVVKRRALDKVKARKSALRALKPKPSDEEIAAEAVARAQGQKASKRRYRVKARDALRGLRRQAGLKRGLPHKKPASANGCALTPAERRARKAETDRRYRTAAQEALRGLRNQTKGTAKGL